MGSLAILAAQDFKTQAEEIDPRTWKRDVRNFYSLLSAFEALVIVYGVEIFFD